MTAATGGAMSPGELVLVGVVTFFFALGCLGMFAYTYSRHRVFTKGLRGTAVVVAVEPTFLMQRRSVIEKPTERVTVATAAWPRGHAVDQKLPAGQYRVGEIVPVVQAKGRPERIFLDRPDLERSAFSVYAPLGMFLMIPVILYASITGPQ
ncbi:hypothetical protein [Cellulomonas sp. URHB0016]